MWDFLCHSLNGGQIPRRFLSMYCGDGAGRPKAACFKKDFSASDFKFALNIGSKKRSQSLYCLTTNQHVFIRWWYPFPYPRAMLPWNYEQVALWSVSVCKSPSPPRHAWVYSSSTHIWLFNTVLSLTSNIKIHCRSWFHPDSPLAAAERLPGTVGRHKDWWYTPGPR